MNENNPLNSIFGKMETEVGTDIYQAGVEAKKSQALYHSSHAKLAVTKAGMIALSGFVSVIVAAPPVTIWLWKWALGA